MALAGLGAALLPGCGVSGPVDQSARPETRPRDTATLQVFSPPPAARPTRLGPTPQATPARLGTAPAAEQAGFRQWVAAFRPRALAQGISSATFDRAFRSARYLPEVIARDRNQAEFTRTIWDYLDSAVSDSRIRNGRRALADHARTLDRIEARFGVPREIVVAIWGMESAYGARRGDTPLISALATLAEDGRRGRFFEEQLIAALKIVQAGDVAPEQMTGSWAGAMGHTQFIPTSYLAYAADYHGDGRRDIWSDDPSDALASTANYLAKSGWTTGQPWGVEVILPAGFNHALSGKGNRRPVSDWARMGVRATAGGRLPDEASAAILTPAGARGPALMIFDNFRVISRYNSADSYVIGVGHLADRLRGAGAFRAPWPRGDSALNSAQRRELQSRLTNAGFDTRGVDGRIGPNTIDAIRAWQRANGRTPDGYASMELLRSLR
jgi:membrane-bound lytic murein transglycosylase B